MTFWHKGRAAKLGKHKHLAEDVLDEDEGTPSPAGPHDHYLEPPDDVGAINSPLRFNDGDANPGMFFAGFASPETLPEGIDGQLYLHIVTDSSRLYIWTNVGWQAFLLQD